MERVGALGRCWRHALERNVHRQERDVDVAGGANLDHAFRHTRHVDALAADAYHVAPSYSVTMTVANKTFQNPDRARGARTFKALRDCDPSLERQSTRV